MNNYKPLTIFDGLFSHYKINEKGECLNQKGNKLKPILQGNGYLRYNLCGRGNDGKNIRKQIDVHRLVAHEFISPIKLGMQVNHKNFNKTDNRVENLEWVSDADNKKHYCDNNGKDYFSFEDLTKMFKEMENGVDRKQVIESYKIKEKTLESIIIMESRPEILESRMKETGLSKAEYRKLLNGYCRISNNELNDIIFLKNLGFDWKEIGIKMNRDRSSCRRAFERYYS